MSNDPVSADVELLRASRSARAEGEDLLRAVHAVRRPLTLYRKTDRAPVRVALAEDGQPPADCHWVGGLPPVFPEWLGDPAFAKAHRVRFPYVAGAMANGIATPRMVVAMARAGMLGFFGAAGLLPDRIEAGLREVAAALDEASYGTNLIHAPNEPALEEAVVDLYLRLGVERVSASAYADLTPALVRLAVSGLSTEAGGAVRRARYLFAKVSRPEVAERFMRPAPGALLAHLVSSGRITRAEAEIAARIPLAEDVTVEADSGGHTDNRPLAAMFGVIAGVRDKIMAEYAFSTPIRLGAAGGLGTPDAVASAFALGASYVLTGSINQACVESGLSEAGRALLADASVSDVAMAPAADMFEQGVQVQVLRRGTLFVSKARRLFDIYTRYPSLEAIERERRAELAEKVLGASLDDVWAQTEAFFRERDPNELALAARDPKHRLALLCRWYLGCSSRWAISGHRDRRHDYQIWCGPAMGAFNAWAKGSFLSAPSERSVTQVALNLLEGAAVLTRAQALRAAGVALPASAFAFTPRRLALDTAQLDMGAS